MDNLVLLCRHHHRQVHEGGYNVQVSHQGIPGFADPVRCKIPKVGEKFLCWNTITTCGCNMPVISVACPAANDRCRRGWIDTGPADHRH